MKSVYAYYKSDKGIDESLDIAIRKIMRGFREEGSGCYLVEPKERDISFEVPDEQVDSCIIALEHCGFRTQIFDIESENV